MAPRTARKKSSQKKQTSISKAVKLPTLIFVVGVAGAGKSTALATLSDSGFFTIDNLPVPLVHHFLSFTRSHAQRYRNIAILLNINSSDELQLFFTLFDELKSERTCRIIFLDCKTEQIIRRYSETRRPHPVFDPLIDNTIEDAILREKEKLFPLRQAAHTVIETSTQTVHDLRREIRSFLVSMAYDANKAIRINFVSFGFKYGIPADCDLVVDVRFLPNPYFIPDLREKTGLEKDVQKYVLRQKATGKFIKRYQELLLFLIPQYIFEGKSYLNIGIGCTGGKHRSVVIAEQLRNSIKSTTYLISIRHRDLGK